MVEELKIGICKEVTPRTLASESGSFGRMNYNAFCAGTWLVRDENNEMQPNLMTSWEILDKGSTIGLPLPRIRELRGMMESHLRLTMSSLRSI